MFQSNIMINFYEQNTNLKSDPSKDAITNSYDVYIDNQNLDPGNNIFRSTEIEYIDLSQDELSSDINSFQISQSTLVPIIEYSNDYSDLSLDFSDINNDFSFSQEIGLISNAALPILDDSVLAYLNETEQEPTEQNADFQLNDTDSSDLNNAFLKKHKKNQTNEIMFALKYVKKTFSINEIKIGIFGDKNQSSKSRTQKPFDLKKTEAVKRAIAIRFSIGNDRIENLWSFIRPKLNKKLADMRRTQRVRLN